MTSQRTPFHKFIIQQGATFRRRIRLKVNGVTQSLLGFDVTLYIFPDDDSDPIELQSFTSPPAIVPDSNQLLVINASDLDDNFLEIFFSDEATDEFTWKIATYRLDFEDSGGNISRKLRGEFIIEPK